MRARLYVRLQRGRSVWFSIRRSSRQSTGIGWVPPCKVRILRRSVTAEDTQMIKLTAIMPRLIVGKILHTDTMLSHPSESNQQLNRTITHTSAISPESPKSLTSTVLGAVVPIQLKTSQTTQMMVTRESSAEGRILVG